MSIHVLDSNISDIKGWLSKITIPVVILAFSSWRRVEKCMAMKEFFESLAQKPEYKDGVLFSWANLDDGCGDALRSIGIIDTPHVKIFIRGEEKGSFIDVSTGEGIVTLLNILLNPSKYHHSVGKKLVAHGEKSPFSF